MRRRRSGSFDARRGHMGIACSGCEQGVKRAATIMKQKALEGLRQGRVAV
jgi:hypothetical protein